MQKLCFSIFLLHLFYWQGYIPPHEIPDRFQVHAKTVDDYNKLTYCTADIPKTLNSNMRVDIQLNTSTPTCTSDSLKAYRKYTARIEAKNDFGESNLTGKTPFSKSKGVNRTQGCLMHIFLPII